MRKLLEPETLNRTGDAERATDSEKNRSHGRILAYDSISSE
jgi:hypothetical protein